MLLELQQQWQRSLLHPESNSIQSTNCRGGVRSIDHAFAVYVNNVRANVFNALLQTYPATYALAGEVAMRRAILTMLRQAPPTSGDMGVYGGALSDEIVRHVDATHAVLIGEVARYEWSLDQLRRVTREPTWSIQAAATLPPEQWASLRLRLTKQATLFESALAVRAACEAALNLVSLTCNQPVEADRLLMVAGDDDVVVVPLGAPEAIWLRALVGSFEYATEQAVAMDAQFDLQSFLATLFSLGALAIPEASEVNSSIGVTR